MEPKISLENKNAFYEMELKTTEKQFREDCWKP